jgi:hypothetical protein
MSRMLPSPALSAFDARAKKQAGGGSRLPAKGCKYYSLLN